MDQTTLQNRLHQAHGKKVAWILGELTREELTEARDNPELWMFAANIAAEAARRYFNGVK